MLEGPEVEAHVHHKTGHGPIDKILAVTAVFVSCISVVIAVGHGHTMEKLVAANSWPNLGFSSGNLGEDGKSQNIVFTLRNTGVGPARIDSVELFYNGTAQKNAAAFLKACCGAKGNGDLAMMMTSAVQDEVLPARDEIGFLEWPRTPATEAIWQRLDVERMKVRLRVCYCSVFEECWIRDTSRPRPVQTEECHPSQAVAYR
jgi:hypothetical protein